MVGRLRICVLLQLQVIIFENEHARFVLVAAAVVGRGEDRDYVGEGVFSAPSVHLKALLFDLVPAENTQQAVLAQKLLHWLLAEIVGAVALGIFLEVTVNRFFVLHGISPHQVAEDSIERDLLLAVDLVNLIEHLEAGGDAAMHGQVFTGDIARDGHRIENFHEQVIDFSIEALQDFVAEGESFGHVSRLVIASQHHDVSGEVLLNGKEKNADLDAEDATVDIVTEEEVVERAWLTGLANHVQQVRVLPMDVADDANRLIDLHEVRLCGEHLQS